MIRERIVALSARMVKPATPHPDCNDVETTVVMATTSLRIQINPVYVGHLFRHKYLPRDSTKSLEYPSLRASPWYQTKETSRSVLVIPLNCQRRYIP
jgi:hypothetical protein